MVGCTALPFYSLCFRFNIGYGVSADDAVAYCACIVGCYWASAGYGTTCNWDYGSQCGQ